MKYYVNLILLFFYITQVNAQSNTSLEIIIDDTFNKRVLLIENNPKSLDDSLYLVEFSTREFINKKKMVKRESRTINNSILNQVQDKIINLYAIAIGEKRDTCLDGITIRIKFNSNFNNNIIEQNYSCVSEKSKLYNSIDEIFSLIGLKKEK